MADVKKENGGVLSPVSESLVLKKARAKYVPDYVNGGLRLASVCEFSRPVFNSTKLSREEYDDPFDYERECRQLYLREISGEDDEKTSGEEHERSEDSVRRSIRRARLQVFDLCVCNRFDLFSTFTFSPDEVDRFSYEETYKAFKIWLSNRVQRRGLRYVAVPEYHHRTRGIHFHMLSNADPVDFVFSGHYAHDKPVYNIQSWRKGFSTAQFIDGEKAVDVTSKYIAKYITKSQGEKIGGRFYLSGGDLVRPTYVYADSINELVDHTEQPLYEREIVQDWGTFTEKSYI